MTYTLRVARRAAIVLCAAAAAACRAPASGVGATGAVQGPHTITRLPTGARLDPVAPSVDLGSMPLAMAFSPDSAFVAVLMSGWREQGVQIVERATGRVTQTLPQRAAFLGLAFAPDGRTLYASGGNEDAIYAYRWQNGRATLTDSIVLAPHRARQSGRRYPAGLALSPDAHTLYAAENLDDSVAVVDLPSRRVVQRLATEAYPYGVVTAPNGTVYVSAWGGHTVSIFAPDASGRLHDAGRLPVARHPSALLLNADGSRLFVASGSTDRVDVVDTQARRVIAELHDAPPAGPGEGSTPNALALAPDGRRLFVAEADNNAVAVFDLSARTSGIAGDVAQDTLAGRLPTDWYPTAVLVRRDTLLVLSGKGLGTAPNPDGPSPAHSSSVHPRSYTLGQTSGTLMTVALARASTEQLAPLSARVASANGWGARDSTGEHYPPFQHVIYVIKENRTYDQVLGDLTQADGDTALLFFPRTIGPNHHALAERFGIFDRFFVDAEVSADGHNWSTAAYATDYLEKTVPSEYSGRGRTYDYEGTNRGRESAAALPDDDVAAPANGYLWDLAARADITFRNYGEFVVRDTAGSGDQRQRYVGDKPFLRDHTNPHYAGFDLDISDQSRMDVWLSEFNTDVETGRMPALEVIRLPNDHTAGMRAGAPTPRAYFADNDLALGRMIGALSRSPFWKSTVVFVLEDDAQNGPDHVDSHRSVLLVISPYNHGGVIHRFVNTTDVIATMAEILHLGPLSQFDFYGRPLRDIFAATPDLAPYDPLTPDVALNERNPKSGIGARESRGLDLSAEDRANEDLFNRVLWRAIKGPRDPYPGATRQPAFNWQHPALAEPGG